MRTGLSIVLASLAAACTANDTPFWYVPDDGFPDGTDADATDGLEPPDIPDTTETPVDGPRDTIGMICATDEECQNGIYCDGRERCPYGFCMAGSVEDLCDDSDDCTADSCVEETHACENEPMDDDSDTYPPESCGGDDCDDTDAAVHPGATEVCGDGVDQDCDGFDGDSGTCTCPTPITSSGTITGSTSGSSTMSPTTCGSGGGPEKVFVVEVTGTRSVTFATAGTSWDTVLYVRSGSCTGTEVGCDDDGGSGVDSFLTVSLSAGTRYYLVLDGYSSSYMGAFTLSVSGL